QVSLLGQAVFETGFEFAGTEVGGLSGLVYDAAKDAYYALSDDRGDRPGPIPEMGSLSQYVGFSNGSYFIQVPEGEINDFFAWKADYPDLISAHRGGFAAGFPENAIETFENTLTFAPALLEVDVRRTGDGQWILMHDDSLDRTTNGTGLVSETSLADIQALQLVDNDGNLTAFQAPTLQEALEWAEGRAILEIDLKSDEFVDEVVQIITVLDAEDQVRFITQNIDQATAIYNQNPDIHLGLFINPDNQAEVFAAIAAAPFGFENTSAFTGVRPQPVEFYQSLHNRGMVAIQGVFGNQDFWGEPGLIDDFPEQQRDQLFTMIYASGGDAIASDFYPQIAKLVNYSQSPLCRYYTLTIDLSDGGLEDGDVAFTDVTFLLNSNGAPFPAGELDPEGIALNNLGALFIASEGDANNLIAPFVNQFSLAGRQSRELPIPAKFLPTIELDGLGAIAPVEKRLLLDFEELGIRLDNSEALAFGPTLPNGRQSLLVVSDNNFNPNHQITQFIAFALDIEPVPQPPLARFVSAPAIP
ncbi:MAG: esterase-like activity of phytase family protein, partial [Pseudanabaenales cyanobacterium]|nr:esterase-like activity of phytase family protein [Pseudanabaenales cyanobacterium]